jgi:hypothetical protein
VCSADTEGSATSVYLVYQLTCHIPEDLHLQWCHSENLKFCSMQVLMNVQPVLACDNKTQKRAGIHPLHKWDLRAHAWVFKHSNLKCTHMVQYFLNGIQEWRTNLLLLDWCIEFIRVYTWLYSLTRPYENTFPPNDILSTDDLWCRLTAVLCMRWLWYAVSVVFCGLKVIVLQQGHRTCQTGCAYLSIVH